MANRPQNEIDSGLAALRAAQARGEAPPPGMSRADLARHAGLSEATIRRIEATFRARLAAALLSDESTPVSIARLVSRSLT